MFKPAERIFTRAAACLLAGIGIDSYKKLAAGSKLPRFVDEFGTTAPENSAQDFKLLGSGWNRFSLIETVALAIAFRLANQQTGPLTWEKAAQIVQRSGWTIGLAFRHMYHDLPEGEVSPAWPDRSQDLWIGAVTIGGAFTSLNAVTLAGMVEEIADGKGRPELLVAINIHEVIGQVIARSYSSEAHDLGIEIPRRPNA